MRPLALLALVVIGCGGSPAKPPPTAPSKALVLVNVDADGVALGGHDPISYRDGAPAAGAADHASQLGGATYRFSTAQHKAAFDADGAKNAPGFGGYCAYAASQNRLSPSDPKVFLVHDGQLLVFTNPEFLELFKQDPAGNKQKADANWPGLVAKHGKPAAP